VFDTSTWLRYHTWSCIEEGDLNIPCDNDITDDNGKVDKRNFKISTPKDIYPSIFIIIWW
jgi:hypothetical protein